MASQGQPHFNDHYKDLLKQLPPSMKKDVWLRLITRKNNPLSEEQAREIRPEIEELLTKEVNRYYKKKDRQRLKVDANATPDGSSALSRLDGFEKQLEEREASLKLKENNIKKSIESQVSEERKHLKDGYDYLELQLKTKYEQIFREIENRSFTIKSQLESGYNSRTSELEMEYRSRFSSLDATLRKKDKEIAKISSAFTKAKDEIKDLKTFYEHEYRILVDVINAKDLKIIDLDDKLHNTSTRYLFDETIEPKYYNSHKASEEWLSKHEYAKKHPEIRKKYTFRPLLSKK